MAQLKVELQQALRDKAALARLNEELMARVSPASLMMKFDSSLPADDLPLCAAEGKSPRGPGRAEPCG